MTRPATNSTRRKGTVRCAIYTRKSSEEGLEQEFNSLQAQREACEAFITSQRHEAWVCLRAGYDDGGFSGGTMDRPALQRLLADIAAGRVDTVVVYKIDRLTRSLTDFAVSHVRRCWSRFRGSRYCAEVKNREIPGGPIRSTRRDCTPPAFCKGFRLELRNPILGNVIGSVNRGRAPSKPTTGTVRC